MEGNHEPDLGEDDERAEAGAYGCERLGWAKRTRAVAGMRATENKELREGGEEEVRPTFGGRSS
jgi:hypothetical protein